MKVAFATKDLVNIDEHFGWAKQFAVYEITKDGFGLSEIVKTEDSPESEDDKINSKIDMIKGASIVIVTNEHGKSIAKREHKSLALRGFPIFENFGHSLKTDILYEGSAQLLFEVANLIENSGH